MKLVNLFHINTYKRISIVSEMLSDFIEPADIDWIFRGNKVVFPDGLWLQAGLLIKKRMPFLTIPFTIKIIKSYNEIFPTIYEQPVLIQ